MWPDWAIYCTWGNFLKPVASIFVKVSKSFIFLVKSFLGNFYRRLATLNWSHWRLTETKIKGPLKPLAWKWVLRWGKGKVELFIWVFIQVPAIKLQHGQIILNRFCKHWNGHFRESQARSEQIVSHAESSGMFFTSACPHVANLTNAQRSYTTIL